MSLHTSMVEFYNEAVVAIVESLSGYFKANVGSNYARRFKTKEEEKEFQRIDSSIQLHSIELLHALSCFSTSQSELRLSVSLVGSHIAAHLFSQLLFSETEDSRIKAVACACVENLIRHHDGLFAINAVDKASQRLLGASFSTSFVMNLVRSIKLLRSPNSMQGTASVVGNLRILLAVLQRCPPAAGRGSLPSVATHNSSLCAGVDWKWLARLMYDRRGEVKLLALQVLAIVVKSEMGATGAASGGSSDSVAVDVDADEMEACRDRSDQQWPPMDVLYSAVKDSAESRMVRVTALSIVVERIVSGGKNDTSAQLSGVNYLVIFSAIADCLSLNTASGNSTTAALLCAPSVDLAVSLVLQLLAYAHADRDAAAEVIPLVRSLKILPLLVDLLQCNISSAFVSAAVERVSSVSANDHADLNRSGSDLLPSGDPSSPFSNSSEISDESIEVAQHSKYLSACHSLAAHAKDSVHVVQTRVVRLLLLLSEVDGGAGPARGLFSECLRHTAVVRHLLYNMSHMSGRSGSDRGTQFELLNYSAHSDLLCLLVVRDESSRGSSSAAAGSPSVLQSVLAGNDYVVEDMLKQMAGYLRYGINNNQLLCRGAHAPHAAERDTLHFFDAIFRLLGTMLSSGQCRRAMSLGGPAPGYAEMGQYSLYLFRLVLCIREEICSLTGAAAERLLVKTDLTVSLFLQHAYTAREVLLRSASDEEDSEEGASLFDRCVQVVGQAAEFLLNPPPSQSAVSQSSAVDAAVSSRKTSLKAVNSRLGKLTAALNGGAALTSSVSVASGTVSHADSLAVTAASKASTANANARSAPMAASRGAAPSISGRASVSTALGAGAASTASNRWCVLHSIFWIVVMALFNVILFTGVTDPEDILSTAAS